MKTAIKYISISCFILLFFNANLLKAEDFSYKHNEGDRYRIISTIHEDVYLNGVLHHRAEILNRIAVEVTSEVEGKGTHKAVFQTSERAVTAVNSWQLFSEPGSFQWAREYESEFERDRLGRMNIDKKYYMPVVRDVPVFTGRDIQVGEKWTYEGHEVHDFRDSFGIPEPYLIPFNANYVFLGDREWKGKTYPAFSVNYRVQSSPQAVPGKVWPRRIMGTSDQIVYWDSDIGQPVAYHENFNYLFEFSDGTRIEYRGNAEAEIIESERMDKERLAEEIADDIDRLEIPNVSVRVVDEGISITLDDILFRADTAIMLPGEREKLDKIVEILLRYPDRDILVGGHTALAGSAEGHTELSTARASVVADYLIARKARSQERVVVRGYGPDRPRADNSTEEGRRMNRRVEIIILEK
jgi:outer membrane protein OmpA-like peptidoglycan-associated protein